MTIFDFLLAHYDVEEQSIITKEMHRLCTELTRERKRKKENYKDNTEEEKVTDEQKETEAKSVQTKIDISER